MKKVSIEIENKIIKEYNIKFSKVNDIATNFNCHKTTVYKILKRNNILKNKNCEGKNRIYNRNDDYFEKIDTEDKAYFLGLLFADGNNFPKSNRMSISLKDNDKYILERFKDCIEYTGPIRVVKNKNQVILAINSYKITKDLTKLGCVENKSLVLSPPDNIPKNLLRHFIRGIFDGDGSVGIYKRRDWVDLFSFVILGSSNMCKYIQKIIELELNIKTHFNPISSVFRVAVYKKEDVLTILNWLYKDTELYLERKHDIYLQMINFFKNISNGIR